MPPPQIRLGIQSTIIMMIQGLQWVKTSPKIRINKGLSTDHIDEILRRKPTYSITNTTITIIYNFPKAVQEVNLPDVSSVG